MIFPTLQLIFCSVYLAILILLYYLKVDILRNLNLRWNPNCHKFNREIYRGSFESSILVESFKLEKTEKNILDNFKKYAEDIVGFPYIHKQDIFIKMYIMFKSGITEKEIKFVIEDICRYLKIDFKYINIQIYNINDYFKGDLGYFKPKGLIGGEIGIGICEKYDFNILFSVIIHECIHYYMHVNSVMHPIDNERFTDFLGVYLGLGQYLINGYKNITILDEKFLPGFKDLAIGYLNEEQLSYVERKFNF